jgi:hypothetical protein
MDFTISAAQQLVVVTAHEPSKLPETLAQCAELSREPEFTPGFSLLFDARGLRRFAGPNQRRLLAEAARALDAAGMRRVAIVVANERTFNLAKTAAEIGLDVGLELGVFRSMLAALYWIDFPRAHALGGSDDVPAAVLAQIGGGTDLEELEKVRRAS